MAILRPLYERSDLRRAAMVTNGTMDTCAFAGSVCDNSYIELYFCADSSFEKGVLLVLFVVTAARHPPPSTLHHMAKSSVGWLQPSLDPL